MNDERIFINKKNLGVLKSTFKSYLEKKISSHEIYMRDIDVFLSLVLQKAQNDNINSFFQSDIIKIFHKKRRSGTANAALVNFLGFLLETKRISKIEYYEMKEELKKFREARGKIEQVDFLSESQIDFILGSNVKFRFIHRTDRLDREYKIVGAALWSLSYLGLEQKELIAIEIDDVDLDNKRIRNLKYNENKLLTEWIDLDKRTYEIISNYIDYRLTLSIENNKLFILKNRVLTNQMINSVYSILLRTENKDRIGEEDINVQKMIRSRILHSLNDTKGSSLIYFIKIHGVKNTQVINAVNEHLKWMKEEYKNV